MIIQKSTHMYSIKGMSINCSRNICMGVKIYNYFHASAN